MLAVVSFIYRLKHKSTCILHVMQCSKNLQPLYIPVKGRIMVNISTIYTIMQMDVDKPLFAKRDSFTSIFFFYKRINTVGIAGVSQV